LQNVQVGIECPEGVLLVYFSYNHRRDIQAASEWYTRGIGAGIETNLYNSSITPL
jgi:hypothetical protein